ncbi:MAG: protein phosphatase 2C domain-containing protein, partial [Candidatus Obscuribacterales bacterium]|nr:protein phosphatase 2C domain-containing protein [Candidatus Obscuribacterales bacterium]
MTLSSWDVSGSTERGGRVSNEDAFAVLMNKRLLMVADGMGGHSGGALASSAACLSVQKEAESFFTDEKPDIQGFLQHCTARAHASITALNGDRRGRERMGSTLTMVYLDDAEMHMVWVGDSRVY